MSSSAEEFPSSDSVHVPGIDEVLARLANGTLGEVSDPDLSTDRQTVVFVGWPAPEADDTVYLDTQGDVVYPLGRKFERGHEGWQLGDVVRADLRVVPNDLGGVALRTDMPDARYDDVFTLGEDDQNLIAQYGLARLDFDVEIAGPQDGFIIPVYPARIRRINSTEALWDGERAVAQGEQVLAQGEVVAYTPPSWSKEHKAVAGSLTLRLASGKEVTSAVHNWLYIGRGTIDVVHPSTPLVGEVIQTHLYENDGGRMSFGTKPPITTPLQVHPEVYLITPDPERLAAYTAHREAIATAMAELAKLEGATFRRAAAALIREHLETRYVPKTLHLTNLMSAKEQGALLQLMAEKFPNTADGTADPDGMYLSSTNEISLSWFVSVSDTLVVNTLAMSRQEYLQFCEDLVTRKRSSEPHTYVNVHPLTYLDRDFTPEQQFALLRKGCETWLAYAAGKTVLKEEEAVANPATQLAYHEDNVFRWVLSELSALAQKHAPAAHYCQESVWPLLDDDRRGYYEIASMFSS